MLIVFLVNKSPVAWKENEPFQAARQAAALSMKLHTRLREAWPHARVKYYLIEWPGTKSLIDVVASDYTLEPTIQRWAYDIKEEMEEKQELANAQPTDNKE